MSKNPPDKKNRPATPEHRHKKSKLPDPAEEGIPGQAEPESPAPAPDPPPAQVGKTEDPAEPD
jgi:hypothetical protein